MSPQYHKSKTKKVAEMLQQWRIDPNSQLPETPRAVTNQARNNYRSKIRSQKNVVAQSDVSNDLKVVYEIRQEIDVQSTPTQESHANILQPRHNPSAFTNRNMKNQSSINEQSISMLKEIPPMQIAVKSNHSKELSDKPKSLPVRQRIASNDRQCRLEDLLSQIQRHNSIMTVQEMHQSNIQQNLRLKPRTERISP